MSDKLSKVSVYTMKSCGRSNLSITWGGEWSGSGPGCFTSGNETLIYCEEEGGQAAYMWPHHRINHTNVF